MAKITYKRRYADGGLVDVAKNALTNRQKVLDAQEQTAQGLRPAALPRPPIPTAPLPAPAPVAPAAPVRPVTSDAAMAKAARFQWELDHPGVPYTPPKMADGGYLPMRSTSNFDLSTMKGLRNDAYSYADGGEIVDPEALMGGDRRPPQYPPEFAEGGAVDELPEFTSARGTDVVRGFNNGGAVGLRDPSYHPDYDYPEAPNSLAAIMAREFRKGATLSTDQAKVSKTLQQMADGGTVLKNLRRRIQLPPMQDGGGVSSAPARGHMVGRRHGMKALLADGGKVKNSPAGGGVITGKGGPTDDKQPIMASPGEYVMPADTVQEIGKDNLDQMVEATHTPSTKPKGLRNYQDGGITNDFGDIVDRYGNPLKSVARPETTLERVAASRPAGVAQRAVVGAGNVARSTVGGAMDVAGRIASRVRHPFGGSSVPLDPRADPRTGTMPRTPPQTFERFTPPGAPKPVTVIDEPLVGGGASESLGSGANQRGPYSRVNVGPQPTAATPGYSPQGLADVQPDLTRTEKFYRGAVARGMTDAEGKITARGVASAAGRMGLRALPVVGTAAMALEPSQLSEPDDPYHTALVNQWNPPRLPPVELTKMTPEELSRYTATTVNNANAGMYADQASRAAQQRGIVTPSSAAAFRAPAPDLDATLMKPGEGEGYATGVDAQGVRRVLHAYPGMDTPNVGSVSSNALGAAMGIPMSHAAPTSLGEATNRARDALADAASGKYGEARATAAKTQLAAMDSQDAAATAKAQALKTQDQENILNANVRQAQYEKDRDTGFMSTAPKIAQRRSAQANINANQADQALQAFRTQQADLEKARMQAEAQRLGHEYGLRGQLGAANIQAGASMYSADAGARAARAQLQMEMSKYLNEKEIQNRNEEPAWLQQHFTSMQPDPKTGEMKPVYDANAANDYRKYVKAQVTPEFLAQQGVQNYDQLSKTHKEGIMDAFKRQMDVTKAAQAATGSRNDQPMGLPRAASLGERNISSAFQTPWSPTQSNVGVMDALTSTLNPFNASLPSSKTVKIQFEGTGKEQEYPLEALAANRELAATVISKMPKEDAERTQRLLTQLYPKPQGLRQ